MDWKKVRNGDIEPLDFIFSGLLAGTVGAIIASGGAGKSYLGLGICAALTAKDVLGMGIESADYHVCYVTAEDPMEILEHRTESLISQFSNSEIDRLEQYVEFHSLHGYTPQIIDNNGKRDEGWISALKRLAKGKRLLFLDTLRKFHKGEENDSGQMTLVTQILDEIASQTGCAILFLHHANKLTQLSGQGANQAASRGSSALVDNIRFQINMLGMSEKEAEAKGVEDNCRSRFVKIIGAKANYTEKDEDLWLRRDTGGVLVKAEFDLPAVVKKSKSRKTAEHKKTEINAATDDNDLTVDPTDPESVKGLTYQDMFGPKE